MTKMKNRKVVGLSLNPEEADMVELMMASGGYTSFSEFAKAKIFGATSENEKRFKGLEIAIDNLRQGYERHHNLWVDTVKKVSGSDSEPIVAATYWLLHMLAGPQDRAVLGKYVDLALIKETVSSQDNGYRPATHQSEALGSTDDSRANDVNSNPYQQGKTQ